MNEREHHEEEAQFALDVPPGMTGAEFADSLQQMCEHNARALRLNPLPGLRDVDLARVKDLPPVKCPVCGSVKVVPVIIGPDGFTRPVAAWKCEDCLNRWPAGGR